MNIAPHNLNLKSNLITLYLVALYSTVEHWPSRERPDVLQSVTEAQAEASKSITTSYPFNLRAEITM